MTSHAHAAPGDMMVKDSSFEPGMRVYNMKLGMWVFLLSEVMFFTSLIGSYIILRFAHPDHFADPGVVLNVPLTAFNTFFLICSSVTMVKAFAAIQKGDQKGLKLWLLATIVIGASFVGIQAIEYTKLLAEGFGPQAATYHAIGRAAAEAGAEAAAPIVGGPLYGATFYTMTGFHGAHVSIGVICLIFVLIRAMRGSYTLADHRGVELIGLYWHFVDLVWIILFTIVYLI
ncbi:MAG: heme-copper oxidase subunit III [Gemmatimonadetes bacterium]|nr:heme-copper oxidase subunit III [Gemmatimonadota bacterium]